MATCDFRTPIPPLLSLPPNLLHTNGRSSFFMCCVFCYLIWIYLYCVFVFSLRICPLPLSIPIIIAPPSFARSLRSPISVCVSVSLSHVLSLSLSISRFVSVFTVPIVSRPPSPVPRPPSPVPRPPCPFIRICAIDTSLILFGKTCAALLQVEVGWK